MIIATNVKMAMHSIKGSKARSTLTMLGVIIGVASVITVVSVGEGVKKQVLSQVNQFGNNVVIVKPGKLFTSSSDGKVTNFNSDASNGASTLTDKDIATIATIPGVQAVSPSSTIAGVISSDDVQNYSNTKIMAVYPASQNILNLKIENGDFFDTNDNGKNDAVIGSDIAWELFKIRDPIGRTLIIRGHEYIVRGTLESTPKNMLNVGQNFNNMVYIPYDTGKTLTDNKLQINELDVRVTDGQNVEKVGQDIKKALLANHANQEDFTVINQYEYLQAANQIFSVITTFVAAVAAISLLVGGIGIMNIMLVSVSERTREIGVRKALGATNRQILSQFLIEATVISVTGGFIGILLSVGIAYTLRLTTDLKPYISLETIFVAAGIATLVGIVFGMAPAIQAARKDPIQALRHE